MMVAVSTYSGQCDGLGLAAEMAGMKVAAYCEAHPKRRAKLAEKHPGIPIFESDEELTADALQSLGIKPDIIFGGPPCQPFSVAGARRAEADPRHRWPEMLRCIQECRPRWVVIENVGGFVNLALDLVLAELEDEGYEAEAVVLPVLAVGAPHRRDRCFVVAYSNSSEWRQDLASCGRMARTDTISQWKKGTGRFGACSESLVHAGRPGRQEHHTATITDNTEYNPRQLAQTRIIRSIESRLGRVLDGVSGRLDEVRWPAWRGEEQHSWEPPRVGQGIPDRPRRVESLGLAVVPWQAYPIFALIMEMDSILRWAVRLEATP